MRDVADLKLKLNTPMYRAARGIYICWVKEGTGQKKYAIRTYERLKGVESVFVNCLRRAVGPDFEKLNEEYKELRAWILEVVGNSDLSGYHISIKDRTESNPAQRVSELTNAGGSNHEL